MISASIPCEGTLHTLGYDGDLVLLDHHLERDLAFQALRDDPPEGCLAVREAWTEEPHPELGYGRASALFDFLEAMVLDDEDVRQRLIEQLTARVAFAPTIEAALETAAGAMARRWRRQLVLLALPHELRLAYCRSLDPAFAGLDQGALRIALIGEEHVAEVLPFRPRAQPPEQ